MKNIAFPTEYNYCAVFLTLSCNLKCSYCINIMNDYDRRKLHHGRPPLSAKDWIAGLNRVEAREDLPISLQGGEPTVHPHFYEIVNGVNKPMDLLTNCQFDIGEFIERVPITKFHRQAPYASIRVSYHPEQMDLNDTVKRVLKLAKHGFQVGVWTVEHPNWIYQLEEAKQHFESVGIDFRTKELLGDVTLKDGTKKTFGTIKYPESIGASEMKPCLCRTTELLIAPDGSIHRCHSDVYNLRKGIGHVLDKDFVLTREFRSCKVYGDCSGCDVKIKTNRFQQHGHTSVEITDIASESLYNALYGDC